MPLSDKLVKEFQDLYENITGKKIDIETAREYAEDIAEVFYIMAKIHRRKKYE